MNTVSSQKVFNSVLKFSSSAPNIPYLQQVRARICKRLRSRGIDSKKSILPAYVAWQAGTSNRVLVPARQAGNRFLGSLKGVQIWAQANNCSIRTANDVDRTITSLRIKYECLVPIYVFPEMKLSRYFQNRIIMFCLSIPTLIYYICERFIYFQDLSVYFAAAKLWTDLGSK